MVRARFLGFVLTVAFLAGAVLAQVQTKTQTKAQAPKQAQAQPTTQATIKAQPQTKAKAPVPLNLTQTPLVFEPNRGQAAAEFPWIARGQGFRIGITADGAALEFRDRAAAVPRPLFRRPFDTAKSPASTGKKTAQSSLVKLHLSGSGGWKAEGASPTGGTSNYFIGNKPANWQVNIPQYAQVKATGVYNGVDLVFHGNQSALEYDFVVAPGTDPRQVQLQFEGAGGLRVEKESGDLVLAASSGAELRHHQPKIYQEVGGKKVSVKGGFEIRKEGTAGFTLGSYDPKLPLVIDPTVTFTTFLGGSDSDYATGVAVDGLGNTYVTGVTYSGDFNVVGGIQGNRKGNVDAFVTKLGLEGAILFSTYLGGGDNDYGEAIAVDSSGVYVTGQTWSDDFPLRQALQPFKNGDADAFVTKLSLLGNALVYSTYLGGSNGENGGAIAVDASQSAYVAGFTTSLDFPIKGEFEVSPHSSGAGFVISGFVSKLSPAGTFLEYSTYLGGSVDDKIFGIAVDGSGSAYVTGSTLSADFPFAGLHSFALTGNPHGTAFLTKLSPAGDSVIYSTSLGLETNYGTGVSLDSAGNAYVSGSYCNPCDANSGSEAFVAEWSARGSQDYFMYLNGADGKTWGNAIATDADGETWVVGGTTSTTFPGGPPITPNPSAGWLVKLDKNGTGPLYTVFLGAEIEAVTAVKPRPRLPVVPAFATIFTAGYRFTGGTAASNEDAFVVRLDEKPGVVLQP